MDMGAINFSHDHELLRRFATPRNALPEPSSRPCTPLTIMVIFSAMLAGYLKASLPILISAALVVLFFHPALSGESTFYDKGQGTPPLATAFQPIC